MLKKYEIWNGAQAGPLELPHLDFFLTFPAIWYITRNAIRFLSHALGQVGLMVV